MPVIYVERAGIAFRIEGSERTVAPMAKEELSGLVYVTDCGHKKYPSAPERFAHKVYKDKSYIIDGNTVYFYPGKDLEEFPAELSPYQLLINSFLKRKNISGNILLVDGNKDAAIISLIVNEEFKQILVSNSKVINETLAGLRKDITKEKIELDNIVLNDAFYAPIFKNNSPIILDPVDILEFAQNFQPQIFKKIEDIKKKLKTAANKKLNFVLAVASFLFILSAGTYLYANRVDNEYAVKINELKAASAGLRQNLNILIQTKFLTKVRIDYSKKIKFALRTISVVPNIHIETVTVSGKKIVISGRILGGYRNFVSGYDLLKEKTAEIGFKTDYSVSPAGKTGFTVEGRIDG